MNIKRPSAITPKAIIITVASVLVVALIIIGGWSFMAIQAESAFATGIANTRQLLKTDLQTSEPDMKAAAEKSDTVAMGKALDLLANRLASDAESAPEPGMFLGISLVSASKISDKQTLVTKAKTASAAFKSAAEVLNYETGVIQPMLAVKKLTGKTLKEQQALVVGWQSMLDQLQKITPPDIALELHTSIIKEVTDSLAILKLMPDLFQKKDQTNFAAKSKELDKTVARLQGLSDVVQKLNQAADKSIAEAYQALKSAIE